MKKAILFTFIILLCTTAFSQHVTPHCKQYKNSKEVLPVIIFNYHDELEESYYYDEYLGYNDDTTGILNYNVLGMAGKAYRFPASHRGTTRSIISKIAQLLPAKT